MKSLSLTTDGFSGIKEEKPFDPFVVANRSHVKFFLSFGTFAEQWIDLISYPFHGKLDTPTVQYLFQIRFAEMSAIEAKADSSTDEKMNETSRS